MTLYRNTTIDGLNVFYREAGPEDAPTIVLLHGFPSSSHMFRDLIAQLADRFHVIAPDYIGFGYSAAPSASEFKYTSENLTSYVEKLLFGTLGLKKFSIYVQDYGAPVGFRIASQHPDTMEGIVVQNGNAYVEGISAAFEPLKPFWANRTGRNREASTRASGGQHHGLSVHPRRCESRGGEPRFLHLRSALSGSARQ